MTTILEWAVVSMFVATMGYAIFCFWEMSDEWILTSLITVFCIGASITVIFMAAT